jgi:methionyl-tRNA synthetase
MAAHYGIDQMRYFFLREVSFGQDGSYSHEAIVNRINADLANDLGNLAQRSLTMIGKHTGAAVPEPGAFSAEDRALLAAADALIEGCRTDMRQQAIHLVLGAIWQVVADANRYFAAQEPWALRKSDPARMATVLYVTAETLRQIAILAQPVMPDSATRLLDLLSVPPDARTFASLGEAGRLEPGTHLPPAQPVFPRYVAPETAGEGVG